MRRTKIPRYGRALWQLPDRPEGPGHSPRVESDDDENVYGHAENNVEHGHEQNSFLQKQSLQKHLKRQKQCQVNHGDRSEEGFLQQSEIEDVISQSEQQRNGRNQSDSSGDESLHVAVGGVRKTRGQNREI